MSDVKAANDIGAALEARLAEAMRETDRILAENPERNLADPTLPIYLVAAEHALLDEMARWERGDKMALLGAIRICAQHDIVLPKWVSRNFIRCYDRVLTRQVGSWDDAFGRPLAKGKHLNAARKKRLKEGVVWLEVSRLHKEGRAIDDILFEDVGRSLGLGKTQVSEFYYSMKPRMENFSPVVTGLLASRGRDELAAHAVAIEACDTESPVDRLPRKRETLRKDKKKR